MRKLNVMVFVAIAVLMFGCSMVAKDVQLTETGFQQLQANELEAAEQSFVEALNHNPNNPYAMLNLGVVYQNTNRIDQAVEMYQQVIDRNGPETVGKSTKEGNAGKTLVDLAKANLSNL